MSSRGRRIANPPDPEGAPSNLPHTLLLFTFALSAALAQPGQPAPVRPSLSMQDSNLKPALPGSLKGVGIDQRLDQSVPLDLIFRDEFGKTVTLASYFHAGKPVLLAPVYYRCPMLCGEVLSGLSSALKVLKFNVGDEFNVLTVSFDPKDTSQIGAAKKAEYMERYGRPGADQGWHFLTGPQSSIDALTKAAGFQYQYDPKTEQFAHSTAIMILTPEGKIAQYYYGVEYAPKDLRLGLVQASENKIGTITDQILLYCYHYDPTTGKYGAMISRILQLSAMATVLILGVFMTLLFRHGSDAEHRAATRVINHG